MPQKREDQEAWDAIASSWHGSATSSGTARCAPPRSTPTSPSRRCVRSRSATGRRFSDERHPRHDRRRFPCAQASSGVQVRTEEATLRLLVAFSDQQGVVELVELMPSLLDAFNRFQTEDPRTQLPTSGARLPGAERHTPVPCESRMSAWCPAGLRGPAVAASFLSTPVPPRQPAFRFAAFGRFARVSCRATCSRSTRLISA